MPLRAEGEALGAPHRHRLDHAVRRRRLGGQSRRQLADALAVDGIDQGFALAQYPLEDAARRFPYNRSFVGSSTNVSARSTAIRSRVRHGAGFADANASMSVSEAVSPIAYLNTIVLAGRLR